MAKPQSVDEYLAAQPEPRRAALQQLREQVHAVEPDVEDVISYSISALRLRGRVLLFYAGWKEHCSIYPIGEEFYAQHADELKGYRHSKGTLRFSPDQPLPPRLLEEFVRYRAAQLPDPKG